MSEIKEDSRIYCASCELPLRHAECNFKYLGHTFRHKVLRCPGCGQVYLDEELIDTKIKKLEESLEEK